MNRKETKKLTDKYKKYDSDIFSEDKQNQKLQLLISLEGLKVPKPTSPNLEEILSNMENRINSNTLDMMTKMEDRINSNMINMMTKMEDRINSNMIDMMAKMEDRINYKIDNLQNEMNNRFDKLENRVAILEGFHQADFAKN